MKLENLHCTQISIQNIEITLQRKPIKTLRLAVYPPDGRVRLSVPLLVTAEQVHVFIESRLDWIKKQQHHFQSQPKIPVLQMVSGEEHLFLGCRFPLEVIERSGKHSITLQADRMQLFVRRNTSCENRYKVLENWYRGQLKKRIAALLVKWQPVIGVNVQAFRVRRMKSRWGSCTIGRRRICMNLHLILKPAECLEYVVVHELVHLLERYHNKRFYGLLDQYLGDWLERRQRLNG